MASLTRALTLIRKARRAEAPPKSQHFRQYEPEYIRSLEEIQSLGGDTAMDELRKWMVSEVHRSGHLPTPNAVRREARKISLNRGISIPADSPLRE